MPSCYRSESKPEVLDKTCCFFSGCLGVGVLLLALHLAQFLRPHPNKVGSLTTSMSVRHLPGLRRFQTRPGRRRCKMCACSFSSIGRLHLDSAHSRQQRFSRRSEERELMAVPHTRWRFQTRPGRRLCKMCAWSFQPGDDCSWTVLTDVNSACLFTARTVGAESQSGQIFRAEKETLVSKSFQQPKGWVVSGPSSFVGYPFVGQRSSS